MQNQPIEEILTEQEEIIKIDLIGNSSHITFPNAPVRPQNTLRDILDYYHEEIGVNPDAHCHFFLKRTGQKLTDLNETVQSLGLQEGDVLNIFDDGSVA